MTGKNALLEQVAKSDVCLGAFGETAQSNTTVQNKIYEGLAMRRPVIKGDSPAMRRDFKHEEHILLCERVSGIALASAIISLKNDPELCTGLANNGYNIYQQQFDLQHKGQRYLAHLGDLI